MGRLLRNQPDTGQRIHRALHLLERWRFAVASDGFLWIQPAGPTLCHEDVARFLRLLQDVYDPESTREIVFDFGQVELLGPQWTLVLAHLLEFAGRVRPRVSVVSAHGQPAEVARLYRRSDAVCSLVSSKPSSRMQREGEKTVA